MRLGGKTRKKPGLLAPAFINEQRTTADSLCEAGRDADDAGTVNDFLGDMLAHAENIRAAGFVAIGLGNEGNRGISAPQVS